MLLDKIVLITIVVISQKSHSLPAPVKREKLEEKPLTLYLARPSRYIMEKGEKPIFLPANLAKAARNSKPIADEETWGNNNKNNNEAIERKSYSKDVNKFEPIRDPQTQREDIIDLVENLQDLVEQGTISPKMSEPDDQNELRNGYNNVDVVHVDTRDKHSNCAQCVQHHQISRRYGNVESKYFYKDCSRRNYDHKDFLKHRKRAQSVNYHPKERHYKTGRREQNHRSQIKNAPFHEYKYERGFNNSHNVEKRNAKGHKKHLTLQDKEQAFAKENPISPDIIGELDFKELVRKRRDKKNVSQATEISFK